MLKCIHVVPGETDLRQFPKHILVAMLTALTQTMEVVEAQKKAINDEIDELGEEFREISKIGDPMKAEIDRIKATIDELERPTIKDLMNQHIREYGPVFPEYHGGAIIDSVNQHIRIMLPIANDDWTFQAFDWAKSFIEKHPDAFVDGNKMLNRGYLYINCQQIPKIRL